jgi:hypothetical protein
VITDSDYALLNLYAFRESDKGDMKATLNFEHGHLFLAGDEGSWLLDTGAPNSFGASGSITIGNQYFAFANSYMGLDSKSLSEHLELEALGIIGADILNQFDVVFDIPNSQIEFSSSLLDLQGTCLVLDEFMGIPIIEVEISGQLERMFFDTGAQISYWQSDELGEFPKKEIKNDFFPGVGSFEVQTHLVKCNLSGVENSIKFGSLPGILGMTLMMADVSGIIGNEIMKRRRVGYFPKRSKLVLV